MEVTIRVTKGRYAACKLAERPDIYMLDGFYSLSVTDAEISLFCLEKCVPAGALQVVNDWCMFEVLGPLEFSQVGVLAEISSVLAKNDIPLCAISTFDTDYFFVREKFLKKAIDVLVTDGYSLVE